MKQTKSEEVLIGQQCSPLFTSVLAMGMLHTEQYSLFQSMDVCPDFSKLASFRCSMPRFTPRCPFSMRILTFSPYGPLLRTSGMYY